MHLWGGGGCSPKKRTSRYTKIGKLGLVFWGFFGFFLVFLGFFKFSKFDLGVGFLTSLATLFLDPGLF